MERNDLRPIVLENDFENVADIVASSEVSRDAYVPEISCTGVGGAACKYGCISGCKDSNKDGGNCSESCQKGCKDGCQRSCKGGNK